IQTISNLATIFFIETNLSGVLVVVSKFRINNYILTSDGINRKKSIIFFFYQTLLSFIFCLLTFVQVKKQTYESTFYINWWNSHA
ncbi:MAG: hypothetical protein KAG95_00910, partial [Bacteroidales bacterium]|nr:hypothetical protein [Bacteroidales bacterium]